MTTEEAYKVGTIACTTHIECSWCAREMLYRLSKAFPSNSKTFERAYRDYYHTQYVPPPDFRRDIAIDKVMRDRKIYE